MRRRRLGVELVGVAVCTMGLAGCASNEWWESPTDEPPPSPTSLGPTAAPTSTASADATGSARRVPEGYIDMGDGSWLPANTPGDCAAPAYLLIASIDADVVTEILRPENLIDMGAREFAQGEVGYDNQGRIATYTVAPGDVVGVIGERLCLYNGQALEMLNGYAPYEGIQPGDMLVVDPAAVPGFEYQPWLGEA